MEYELELKPHGKLKADHTKGIYIDREPKGIPDIAFATEEKNLFLTYKAADILSVQGYTARILCVEDVEKFMQQDDRYKNELLPDILPCIFVRCCTNIDQYFSRSINICNKLDSYEIAQVGRNMILEQKEKQI